ncbi:hypothetical protein A3A60_04930 [Candidatus Curtissbacteria bacterium RIFCSPLOWO2_01_FULL_42_26]|uniref:Secondary thiamine-phosphate synthase enzyme n=1 Tax=Candidatus Curtissbacteria bacterium RIFCSPLOWO2_01_FULL_42_26 TaxID=1797729 RepID=A0A1F5I0L7_9BACT|nr:MAG: hypothetical protein A3A60_04930 [Candidatus Curtissbacteria bacterium RIFCSPLOWO2_01_FULL_42_26]
MVIVTIKTQKNKQVVDITDEVNGILVKSKIDSGLCHLFLIHTTAALTTVDLDPGTDLDILDAIEEIIPKLKYRHPHDPTHVKDHIASTMLGTDLTLPFENKKLILGTWQRVVLVEFNGPREREIVVSTFARDLSS